MTFLYGFCLDGELSPSLSPIKWVHCVLLIVSVSTAVIVVLDNVYDVCL